MAYSWTGSAVTGKVVGDRKDYMALAILHNDRFSGHKVFVRRAVMQLDNNTANATSTTLFVPCLTYRGVGSPTIGDGAFVTCAAKSSFDTQQTSDPKVKLYYPATGDGIMDSQLAGTPSGGFAWRQWGSRLRSSAEQFLSEDNNQLPALVASKDFILLPGQYLVFRLDPVVTGTSSSVVGDNNSTLGWFLNLVWQEEAISTHTISGTVKLAGTGVVGAKVTILIDDDTSLANPELLQVVTTTTGGAWTSSAIPNGKIAYAYAQNYTGGTYYSATGAPYVS